MAAAAVMVAVAAAVAAVAACGWPGVRYSSWAVVLNRDVYSCHLDGMLTSLAAAGFHVLLCRSFKP